MKPHHAYRLAEKQAADAELCQMPLTEWLALTRAERKARLKQAKRPQPIDWSKVPLAGFCDHGVGMLDACEACKAKTP